MFLSAKRAVDSGAHNATDSLHKIKWPVDWNMDEHLGVMDVVCPSNLILPLTAIPCHSAVYLDFELFQVPAVMCPLDGCFPGLYCSSMLSDPWLSDQRTMILASAWRSTQVILSIDVLR